MRSIQKLMLFAAYVGIAVIGINFLSVDITIVHKFPKPLQIEAPSRIGVKLDLPDSMTLKHMEYKYY